MRRESSNQVREDTLHIEVIIFKTRNDNDDKWTR